MNIRVKDAPLGHKFTDDKPYEVYGNLSDPFVFDEDCESCFLADMEWEEFEQ